MPLEAALLQDLRHRGIVKLLQHSFVTAPNEERQLWLVSDFCDKGPLDVRCASTLLPLMHGSEPSFLSSSACREGGG
jgi:hypothetical protein